MGSVDEEVPKLGIIYNTEGQLGHCHCRHKIDVQEDMFINHQDGSRTPSGTV